MNQPRTLLMKDFSPFKFIDMKNIVSFIFVIIVNFVFPYL